MKKVAFFEGAGNAIGSVSHTFFVYIVSISC